MPAADLVHLEPALVHGVPLDVRLREQRRDERQIAVLRPLSFRVEDASRLPEPALRGGQLEPDRVVDDEHEPDERRTAGTALPYVLLVGTLIRGERLLVAVGPERRLGEAL